MSSGKTILFIVYLLFGLYFINAALSLITLPDFFTDIDQWIVLIGGILILIGGVNYLRASKNKLPKV